MLTRLLKKIFVLFLIMTFNFIIISSAYTLLTFSAQGEFKSLGFEPSIQDSTIPMERSVTSANGFYPGYRQTIYEAVLNSGTEIITQTLLKITSSGELFSQDNKMNVVPIELKIYIDNAYHTSVNFNTDNIILELPAQTNLIRIDAIWPSDKPYHEYKGTSGSLGFELTISQKE